MAADCHSAEREAVDGRISEETGRYLALRPRVRRDEDDKRKQRYRGGFATKKAAANALRECQNRLDSGFLPQADDLTFGVYMRRWLDHHATQIEPKTMKRYETLARLYLIPAGGSDPGPEDPPART